MPGTKKHFKHEARPAALAPPAAEPRAKELTGRAAFVPMLGISFVIVLVALDQTVVGTALPRVVAELNGFALYSWVATSYLLLSAISVPIAGRLGDMYGRKSFVLAAIVVFTIASVLCGLAQSMLWLVVARGLQGIGGGMLVGTAFGAVVDLFPEPLRRIKWQAMLSTAFGLANAIGPTLGGWLTETWGWRSVFYVNLPIGLVALVLVAGWLPRLSGNRKAGSSVDWSGAMLLALCMIMLLSAVEKGTSAGAASPAFWLLVIAAIAACWFFVTSQRRLEARGAESIVPLRLFGIRAISLLGVISILTGWAMFTLIFYSPLLLQAGFAMSPNNAGLLVTPLIVMMSAASIVNGRLYGRIRRPHRLIAIGVGIFLIGCLAVIGVRAGMPAGWIAAPFAIAGIGLGFHVPNIIIQMQLAVEKRDVGFVAAMAQTTRLLGSLIGAAFSGAVVSAVYRAGVRNAFAERDPSFGTIAHYFSDPQILVSAADQSVARSAALALGPSGGEFLDGILAAARLALINGVHAALGISILLCVIAFFLARRLSAPTVPSTPPANR